MTLTPKQVADRIGISVSLVYQWCQDRVLAHYRFGNPGKRGRIRIEESDLEAFLAECKAEREQARAPLTLKHIRLN